MSKATEKLQDYARDLTRSVAPAQSQVAARRAITRNPAGTGGILPRVAAITVGFLAFANVAAAGVANSSAPGDLLYGIDRGYERVASALGIGGDNSDERLDEAVTLINRADLDGALELVAEAVPDADVEAAVESVAQVEGHEELRAAVLALVNGARQISVAARDGNVDGLTAARLEMKALASAVAEAARNQAGKSPDSGDRGNSGDTPAVTAPGQGNQGNQGQGDQGDQGNQGNQGNQGQGNQDQGNQGQGNQGGSSDTAPGRNNTPNLGGGDK